MQSAIYWHRNGRPHRGRIQSLPAFRAATFAWTLLLSFFTPPSLQAGSPGPDPTNGALVIQIKDSEGRARDRMVLLPVQARSLVQPSSTPSPNTGLVLPTNGTVRPPGAGTRVAITNATGSGAATGEKMVEIQVALVNHAVSPGSIDGLMGSQTRAALRAFQESEHLPATGSLDEITVARLTLDGPLYTNYVITDEDVQRLLPLSPTWLGKSQQPRLDYETMLELVAEKSFAHPNLIKRLNPSMSWTNIATGTEIRIPSAQYPEPGAKASFLRIRLGQRILQAYDAETNLLAHFPCSIAQRVEKRPVGEALHVAVVAPDPNYTFDPAVFPESAEARELGRKLILQPGPNNPVGAVWIGLDKPGYGIHGTPRPEEVGRTESHGCFRLANWNARYLLQLIIVGTPVEVLP